MNIVVIGATSRIAELCVREWNREPAHFVLCARSTEKLEWIAQDLKVRAPANTFACIRFDAENATEVSQLCAAVEQRMAHIDCVLIAHGSLIEQSESEADLATARRSLDVNGTSVVLLAEAFASALERQGHGSLAVIGSVAGDRGRQSNYVYGAAKGLVERYCQGLRNRLYRTGVQVTLIKPGPTDTPMTAALKLKGGRLADPLLVARGIVAAIAAKKAVVYLPGIWRLIMLVICSIPERLFVRTRL